MKQKIAILMAMLALIVMAGCRNKPAASESPAVETVFTTDSIVFDAEAPGIQVYIRADYPVSGPEQLVASVRDYIESLLGETYTGPRTDGKKLVNYYGQEKLNAMKEEYESRSVYDRLPGMFSEVSIDLAENADGYITYTTSNSSFEGGAHGITILSGASFRKSDGLLLSQRMFNDQIVTEGFRQLLVAGLIGYFSQAGESIDNEADLEEYLFSGTDNLKLPEWPLPYLTRQGVVVNYSPYDIAPYAAGNIQFTIPYSVVTPYLSAEVKELIDR